MDNDPRGTLIRQGNIMRINNAFVEEATCVNNSSGSILVSYSVIERNNTVTIQTIRLNLNNRTTILNTFGRRVCICCMQRGMWVNVVFSSIMTRSIPPQSNAFLVVVQRTPQRPIPPLPPERPIPPQPPLPPERPIPPQRPFPPQRPIPPQRPFPPVPPLPPQRPSSVTIGRIILIDFDNSYIITEDPNNRNNQTRFLVTNMTSITNRFGVPIGFNNLQPGQLVRITHANFQTPSIPPQTTAFDIQLI